jgi:hypothetical protein
LAGDGADFLVIAEVSQTLKTQTYPRTPMNSLLPCLSSCSSEMGHIKSTPANYALATALIVSIITSPLATEPSLSNYVPLYSPVCRWKRVCVQCRLVRECASCACRNLTKNVRFTILSCKQNCNKRTSTFKRIKNSKSKGKVLRIYQAR